jgi:hypothetical protein
MRYLLVLLLTFTMAGGSAAQVRTDDGRRPVRDWIDPDLGRGIAEGFATEESLWLRGYSRNIVRLDRSSGKRVTVATGVIDMLVDGPRLWALVAVNDNESVVRDLRDSAWPERRVYFEGTALALFSTPDGPGVLTNEKVLLPAADRWSRHRLAGLVTTTTGVSPLTDDALFLGYNHGEWGGGLRRIDVLTGAVSIVKEPDVAMCEGMLDPECAPVVGVIADLETPGCVLVGTSLAHLSLRRGEILRICGDAISLAFRDPLPVEPLSIVNRPGQSWPFDSFFALSDGWVAVGQERFARAQDGAVTIQDIPDLHAWSGLQVSEPRDGMIFLEAACCWGSDSFVQYRVMAIPIVR